MFRQSLKQLVPLVKDCLSPGTPDHAAYTMGKFEVLPLHEEFARDFKARRQEYMLHIDNPSLLCPNFYEHAVVKLYGAEYCFPIRLFFDKASLTNDCGIMNLFASCVHHYRSADRKCGFACRSDVQCT